MKLAESKRKWVELPTNILVKDTSILMITHYNPDTVLHPSYVHTIIPSSGETQLLRDYSHNLDKEKMHLITQRYRNRKIHQMYFIQILHFSENFSLTY